MKSLSRLLALLACLALVACAPTPPRETTTPTTLPAEPANLALDPVAVEALAVTRTDNGQATTLADYLAAADLGVKQYAILDLDGNGTAETVLRLTYLGNEDYGFLVLYADGNTTYADEIPYRAFNELRADGTFSFSSGVSNHGVGRLSFGGTVATTVALAECAGSPNGPIGYMVEEKAASKAEFDAYLDAQSQKPAAPWQPYPTA